MEILGIDIGGSGIKGAPVNIKTGKLLAEKLRISTPKPSSPQKVAEVVCQLVQHFNWKGPVGCGFPTIMVKGTAMAASNMGNKWVGVNVEELFRKQTGLHFRVINDADAAGLAEMTWGVGKEKMGIVIMITIGTGLGSGFFYDGKLIPNFELGHIPHTNGDPIEFYAADSARKKEKLGYDEWGKRFDYFLNRVVRLFSPDLIIIGGGASKKFDKFKDQITINVPIEVAKATNQAGITGAALAAYDFLNT